MVASFKSAEFAFIKTVLFLSIFLDILDSVNILSPLGLVYWVFSESKVAHHFWRNSVGLAGHFVSFQIREKDKRKKKKEKSFLFVGWFLFFFFCCCYRNIYIYIYITDLCIDAPDENYNKTHLQVVFIFIEFSVSQCKITWSKQNKTNKTLWTMQSRLYLLRKDGSGCENISSWMKAS